MIMWRFRGFDRAELSPLLQGAVSRSIHICYLPGVFSHTDRPRPVNNFFFFCLFPFFSLGRL